MPFIVLASHPNKIPSHPRRTHKFNLQEMESRCKDAWVSMSQYYEGDFKKDDVGGVMLTHGAFTGRLTEKSAVLLFMYVDRGADFHRNLCEELSERFSDEDIDINPIRTEGENWFSDPVWAIR